MNYPVPDNETARVAALREAGVDDEDWIHAVLHHHTGQQESDSEAAHPAARIAELIRRIDVYTAKHPEAAARIVELQQAKQQDTRSWLNAQWTMLVPKPAELANVSDYQVLGLAGRV